MFLLNNIHDREYADIYSTIGNVVFDISDFQLRSSKNRDWYDIGKGSIACVVNSSRKISTFYAIDANAKTDVVEESGNQHVITGTVIAKLPEATDMTVLLNRFAVTHPHLPGNKFSIGFNVASLGHSLDALALRTREGMVTLAQLKLA